MRNHEAKVRSTHLKQKIANHSPRSPVSRPNLRDTGPGLLVPLLVVNTEGRKERVLGAPAQKTFKQT